MRLLHPEADKVQQGSIFNCVSVPGYEGCRCYGIVVTARCDLEHAKQSIVNYLPIVSFADWAKRDLCFMAATTLHKELLHSLHSTLKQKGVSDQTLATFPLEEVIKTEIKEKEQKPLLEKLAHLQLTRRVLASNRSDSPECAALLKAAEKITPNLVRDLITQRHSEFYFLEHTDVTAPSPHGHVVLLRYMKTIASSIIESIAIGATLDSLSSHITTTHDLTFAHDPICLITGVLRSPDIEHLTQSFAHLYMRIGLEDHSSSTITSHLAALKEL